MATLTIEYDARNHTIPKVLDLLVSMGAKVIPTPKKTSSVEISLREAKEGNVFEADSVTDLFKQCGVHV